MAAGAGVKDAKDLSKFRSASSDAMVVVPHPASRAPVKIIPSDVVKSFAYGQKTRPSTPIRHVVSYQYGYEYEQHLEESYQNYENIKSQAMAPLRVRMNKSASQRNAASRASRHAQVEEPKELFKLSKFKKVPAKMKLPDAFAEKGGLSRSVSLPTIGKSAVA